MSTTPWQSILGRVTMQVAEDIDDLLRVYDARTRKAGRDLFPESVDKNPFTPDFHEEDTVVIGVRITETREDVADLAVQLGTFALEKQADIVVLNYLDYCGLERFGFRCERITGETDEAAL